MRHPSTYATSALAHGPTLLLDGYDLTEEGVGFGVPVALRGLEAVFPEAAVSPEAAVFPEAAVSPEAAVIPGTATASSHTVTYRLALGERLVFAAGLPRWDGSRRGHAAPPLVDRAHENLSRLHRDSPRLRPLLDAGAGALRRVLGMTTRYEPTRSAGSVRVTYRRETSDVLAVTVDPRPLTDPAVSALAVMNEVGAGLFTDYRDSAGLRLEGGQIESWAEVRADWAALAAPIVGAEFAVEAVPGTRLYRGRELAPGRLAWAGFGYLLTPPWKQFSYRVRLRPRLGSHGPASVAAGAMSAAAADRRPAGRPREATGRMPAWSLP